MRSIASSPAARRLFATSIVARLPLAMLSIGLMVHVQHLSGSFTAAGVVAGAYALALSIGGPMLGRLVDRSGQTLVLLTSAAPPPRCWARSRSLPAGTPLGVLVALATGIGLAEPPVGACLRTQLSSLLPDPGAVRAAYAFEASIVELTWVAGPRSCSASVRCGPPVRPSRPAAWYCWSQPPRSPPNRPRAAGRRRPQRASRTEARCARRRCGRWSPCCSLVGVLLGADEVAVTAAARALDGTTAAALLLALWGVGSFAGGLLVTRFGGGAAPPPDWRWCSPRWRLVTWP